MSSERVFPISGHRPSDVPFSVYKSEQARISRGRLYPLTVFYTLYATIVLVFAVRSAHPWIGVLTYLAGLPLWTLIEYLFHRYVLHGRFPAHDGVIGRFLHDRLDPLHWEHHARPFDGMHISGVLKDILPLFAVAAPASFIVPVYTAPVLLAGVVQCYVLEEWIHHSVHFYDFRNRYFRYIKRYHRFHHTQPGMELGFGLTSGFWDVVFRTRYPRPVRYALFNRRATQ
jgi:sterol desaturase/sphingolipid hydroxylase (fatty acid hydroxylase superfamily)